MAKDPLKEFYPIWHKDALESARWLRSDEEYAVWCAEKGIAPLPRETREARAKEAEARAARYAQLM